MRDVEELLGTENGIFNIELIVDFFFRKRKVIIFTSSLLFSVLFLNTINSYIKKPVYLGSFSILIQDPIDDRARTNSLQARLALNEYTYKLPTLIQYLKSELVLAPLAKELGISSQSLKNKINITLDGSKTFAARGVLKVDLKGKDKVKNLMIMKKLSNRYLEAANEQRKLKLNSGLDFLNSEMPIIESKTALIKKRIEEFRTKNNIITPLNNAQNLETQKIKIEFKIDEYSANLRTLDLIKKDISLNEFRIKGFVESLSELGFELISSDLDIINKYIDLEEKLAEAKTIYKPKSKFVINLERSLKSLYPEIQKKQLANIDLAIKLNKNKIKLEKNKLTQISEKFSLQPNLLSEYEKLMRDLSISEKNFNSLINAKENFRLELAQKSLPWRILESPRVFPNPISPNVNEETIRNLLISLLVGITIAFLKENIDKVFHNNNEIERILKPFGIPLLGSFPFVKDIQKAKDNDTKFNDFFISESLRNVATAIRFLNINDQENQVFLTTSTKQNEGKTLLTCLLAKTFADLGKKVLVIDADLRRPSIHKFFDLDNIIGLSNLITDNDIIFKNIVQKTTIKNLDILTSGIRPPDPILLLASEKMKLILKQLKSNEDYDFIIFDAPPSQGLSDAKLIAEYSNLTLYIVNMEDTNKDQFKKSITKFYDKTNFLIGVITNRSKNLNDSYGNYDYYYNKNIYDYYKGEDNPINDEKPINEVKNFQSIFNNILNLFNKKTIKKSYKRFMKWLDF